MKKTYIKDIKTLKIFKLFIIIILIINNLRFDLIILTKQLSY